MIFYFGFGANRDLEMIRAITGRGALGVPASVEGFQLCVESMRNIPKQARDILYGEWDHRFVSYGIVPHPRGRVTGTLWLLTDCQRRKIQEWELTGLWSRDVRVSAQVRAFGFTVRIPAVSEELLNQRVQLVPGEKYKTFIVPKHRLLAVARKVCHLPPVLVGAA